MVTQGGIHMAYSKPTKVDIFIGGKLKEARLNKKYSLKALSDLSGVPVSTYFYYENGQSSLPYPVIITLSKILDLDLNELTEEAKKYL